MRREGSNCFLGPGDAAATDCRDAFSARDICGEKFAEDLLWPQYLGKFGILRCANMLLEFCVMMQSQIPICRNMFAIKQPDISSAIGILKKGWQNF